MATTKQVYNSASVARGYALQSHLQPAEETILRIMLPHMPNARMLDIGVGGGRTTLHFAKWAREYVGTDYAESMIAECQNRFDGYPSHINFEVCDATSMKNFEDNSFDFILFSFNGIDSVSPDDRLKVLDEVRRVGKQGAHFCFSTHNLNWAANMFELRRLLNFNPKYAIRTAKRLVMRFGYNRSIKTSTFRSSQHLVFNDGTHYRQLDMYYIRPSAQISQLESRFENIRVFSNKTGQEITNSREFEKSEEPWLYFLCQIK